MTTIVYGTSGFRNKATIIIEQVIPKISAIISALHNNFNYNKIGIMITASHNPIEDNGLKFVNSNGKMLCSEEELALTEAIKYNIEVKPFKYMTVILGYDLRPSSKIIRDMIIKKCEMYDIQFIDMKYTTTPQLHYLTINPKFEYISYLSDHFNKVVGCNKINITVDCANGVGSLIMKELNSLKNTSIDLIHATNYNKVNHKCGAEYVNKMKCGTKLMVKSNHLYASLDGDADRLNFVYMANNVIQLIDGDQIGIILGIFIKDRLVRLSMTDTIIGFVQTAYANSGSTNYINNVLKFETTYAATGVKHLHKKAEKYDVGIYFESNGHGTILFSNKVINILKYRCENDAKELLALYGFMSNLTGDAIGCLLAIMYIMSLGYNVVENLYLENPVKQVKVVIKNKNIIKVNECETKVIYPVGMQDEIDDLLAGCNGRAFVRPSGTEDVVRVYTEGDAIGLIDRIVEVVEKYANY
jgi:phosphoacetylglucosamine mutase